jgi:hypothetical protein
VPPSSSSHVSSFQWLKKKMHSWNGAGEGRGEGSTPQSISSRPQVPQNEFSQHTNTQF